MSSSKHRAGRHFLQIPGPSNVPDSILRAMSQAVVDHRGPDFPDLTLGVLDQLKPIFNTSSPIIIYPSSGTGAWEAALVNCLSPGDKVLAFETGWFATLWKTMAEKLGMEVEWVEGDWRHGVDPAIVEDRLKLDGSHSIKAVCVVHNETSTGATSRISEIRQAIDTANHPALYLVDTISSLACVDYRHDEWKVDVTVSGSQKGLMLPPGLGFNAVSEKALTAAKTATSNVSYWSWQEMIENYKNGVFPYTPATNLLYGLKEALRLLQAEGLDNVYERHSRLANATRIAVEAWDLKNLCVVPEEFSNSLTAVVMPEGHDADALRKVILENFDMSLGTGLGKVKGKIFRIGHLGDFNELMLTGTLSGVEMGLEIAGVPFSKGGINAAMDFLAKN
ncbi:MAG: aminotransferase class V-fold PLP-dependent enzyme [Pseudomonadota bacterium]|nr:aminotransferase class V-fold PLP-dependent enzyme [Pseudomonadota bacterium]